MYNSLISNKIKSSFLGVESSLMGLLIDRK